MTPVNLVVPTTISAAQELEEGERLVKQVSPAAAVEEQSLFEVFKHLGISRKGPQQMDCHLVCFHLLSSFAYESLEVPPREPLGTLYESQFRLIASKRKEDLVPRLLTLWAPLIVIETSLQALFTTVRVKIITGSLVTLENFQKCPFVRNSVGSQFLEGLFAILAECSQFCLRSF